MASGSSLEGAQWPVKKCVSECMSGEGTREWQQATRAGEKHLYSLTRSPLLSMCVCARVVLCVVPPVNQPLLHHLLLDTK